MPAIVAAIVAIFGALWSRLWAFILFALPWIIEKIITFLGFGIVTYIGLDYAIDALQSYVFSQFDGLPSDIFQLLVLADIDYAIKVIFAAIAVVIQYRVASKTIFKKSSFSNPGAGF